ncbi:hypothetical protein [Nitrosomonas communis]|uniref:hypothetical protein n=1 Tax=Nitrosomonas communis TaxID=44574 RepID=UPI0026EA75D3|nr:hypothetical protein [Nitrosomonas communis]MCO6428779.1 hypothetical protein [Nitrosomonas communis]
MNKRDKVGSVWPIGSEKTSEASFVKMSKASFLKTSQTNFGTTPYQRVGTSKDNTLQCGNAPYHDSHSTQTFLNTMTQLSEQ